MSGVATAGSVDGQSIIYAFKEPVTAPAYTRATYTNISKKHRSANWREPGIVIRVILLQLGAATLPIVDHHFTRFEGARRPVRIGPAKPAFHLRRTGAVALSAIYIAHPRRARQAVKLMYSLRNASSIGFSTTGPRALLADAPGGA
jgi:hypothetical protein